MADPEGYSAYDDDEAEPSVEYADHYAGNGAASSRHTKFLDLTNGAGGETGTGAGGGEGGYQEDTMSDTYNDDDDERSPAGNQSNDDAVDALMDAHIRAATNRDVQRSSVRVDPNTPGRVVEPGQEHTGRWTKEEHEAFLSALQMYGKEWKKVAAKVKTRTVVQTRTHAQKYFQKLQKAMEGGNGDRDISKVDMGVASEAKKASTKKKRGNTPSIAAKPRQQEQQQQQQQQQSNMASASQLLSNLTTAAQSIQTPTTNTQSLSASSAFGSAALAGPASFSRPPQQHSLPPRHGFSTNTDAYRPAYATGAYSSFGGGGVDRGWGASTAGAMKINAPDPAESRGKFPEPSPAACGKRKLAEIAAARMLAGVAAIGKPLLPPSSAGNDPDGDVTPPPQSPREFEKPGPPGISLNEAPAPPLMTSSDGGGAKKGLSLQIVNPETFGDPYEERKRRRANGEGSPVTPWDGQLEALVSEKAKKSEETQNMEEFEDSKLPPLPGMSYETPAASKHAVCNYPSGCGRSTLHRAVCEMDIIAVQRELATIQSDGVEKLTGKDDAGFCPIHSACALGMLNSSDRQGVAIEIVRQLITAGADPSSRDEKGNTPLHWAARAGDRAVADLLVSKGCVLDAKNNDSETPLHWAMRVGRKGMEIVSMLLENGARASCLNKSFKRPLDIAADGFDDDPSTSAPKRQIDKPGEKRKRLSKEERRILMEITEERKEVRSNLLQKSPHSRTLILHHPECLEHIPKSESDWEAPDRITSILGRVFNPEGDVSGKNALMPYEITMSSEFERAKLDLLSRVHSTDYLAFVNDLSKELEKRHKEDTSTDDSDPQKPPGTLTPPVVPFTPMVQRSMIKIQDSHIKLGAHSDTSFSAGSLRAARRAAGAVQHAVDCVLIGRNRNAMCVVRPPGHHAGVNGLLDGGESCGFCIFNNIAAGALHAISDERLLCERCAIVDIDVHHGNGTEEIVKKCHDPGKLFFFSIHLYDNEKKKPKGNAFQYKFYPGTGAEDDVAYNIINVALTPLWKEPQEKAAGNTHNTRQKTRSKVAASDSMSMDDSASDVGTPRDRDSGKFSDAESETASSTNRERSPPFSPSGQSSSSPSNSGRHAYRQAIQNRLLPALRAFNPDLILISAGFDAARADVGNARHERSGERMGLDLEPEDYAWTTRKVLEVADICCQGRVVSVLEGGYGRSPSNGQGALDRSNLAECAARHVHAMVDPYDCEGRFST